MDKTKICSKCGREMPATNEYFSKDKKGKYGLRADCKKCYSIYRKKHYNENKTDIRKKQNEYLKQYHKENKKRIGEYKKEYYQENKEKILDYSRHYGKQYREKNKDSISEYRKRYKLNNRELFNKYNQKRRSIKKGLPSTLTTTQWRKIKEVFNYKCAYCGMSEDKHIKEWEEQLHQEHFIPLTSGGEYTRNNIIPACKSCNGSKGNKDFFDWYIEFEHYNKTREKNILEYLGYIGDTQQLSIL